jgi:hypothetical protein
MNETASILDPTTDLAMEDDVSLTEQELEEVFSWVDAVPTNRPKKNIYRDFSDCSLIAEIIKFHLPNSHKGII